MSHCVISEGRKSSFFLNFLLSKVLDMTALLFSFTHSLIYSFVQPKLLPNVRKLAASRTDTAVRMTLSSKVGSVVTATPRCH